MQLTPCGARKECDMSKKSRWTHRVACTLLSTPPVPPASKSLQQRTLHETGRPKHQGFPSAVTQQSDSFFTAYHHCLITPNCWHSPFEKCVAWMYASLNQSVKMCVEVSNAHQSVKCVQMKQKACVNVCNRKHKTCVNKSVKCV